MKINLEPTISEINDACLSYRHDFGLLSEDEKKKLRFIAKEWLIAWGKVFDKIPECLNSCGGTTTAATD
jgi:hypothetical protein